MVLSEPFLQAWIRGVPVVTFFDPDGLVQRLPLGRVAHSLDEMREAIRRLLETDEERLLLGRRAREFAAREFTDGVAARYLELLDMSSPQLRLGTSQEPFTLTTHLPLRPIALTLVARGEARRNR